MSRFPFPAQWHIWRSFNVEDNSKASRNNFAPIEPNLNPLVALLRKNPDMSLSLIVIGIQKEVTNASFVHIRVES